jgi:hypothetical protein
MERSMTTDARARIERHKAKWFELAVVPIREQCDIVINVRQVVRAGGWTETGYIRKCPRKASREGFL